MFYAEGGRYLEVKMQENDHFAVARQEEGVLDVVVQNVHLVTANRREAETWRPYSTMWVKSNQMSPKLFERLIF